MYFVCACGWKAATRHTNVNKRPKLLRCTDGHYCPVCALCGWMCVCVCVHRMPSRANVFPLRSLCVAWWQRWRRAAPLMPSLHLYIFFPFFLLLWCKRWWSTLCTDSTVTTSLSLENYTIPFFALSLCLFLFLFFLFGFLRRCVWDIHNIIKW